MSEAICTCHCGGAMFYRHLHAESCILSREGEEAPKSELQTLRDERDRLIKEYVRLFRLCEPIAKMLSELSILPIGCSRETDEQHDSLIRGHRKQLADAQATVEALQARVRELEQWVQDQSTANLETMRHMDEMQSRAMDAEQQLTQRTAELERVRSLIKALPKVEGEINERFCTGSYYSSPRDYRTHVTFEAALVALLKHRQGMEG